MPVPTPGSPNALPTGRVDGPPPLTVEFLVELGYLPGDTVLKIFTAGHQLHHVGHDSAREQSNPTIWSLPAAEVAAHYGPQSIQECFCLCQATLDAATDHTLQHAGHRMASGGDILLGETAHWVYDLRRVCLRRHDRLPFGCTRVGALRENLAAAVPNVVEDPALRAYVDRTYQSMRTQLETAASSSTYRATVANLLRDGVIAWRIGAPDRLESAFSRSTYLLALPRPDRPDRFRRPGELGEGLDPEVVCRSGLSGHSVWLDASSGSQAWAFALDWEPEHQNTLQVPVEVLLLIDKVDNIVAVDHGFSLEDLDVGMELMAGSWRGHDHFTDLLLGLRAAAAS